jgi:hypothetical protein
MNSKPFVFAMLSFALVGGISAHAANYCLAIRGNGEIEPAHWGGVAQVVERLGLPQAQAGGSSASITMLLVDAIATNPIVKNSSATLQAERASFLLKSLQGFVGEVLTSNQWKDFQTLYKEASELKNPQWSKDLSTLFDQASNLNENQARLFLNKNAALLKRNYATGVKLGLLSQTSYAPLFTAIQNLRNDTSDSKAFARDLAVAKFYASELYSSISVFGAFNAQTDDNLFFRPGIVDFDRTAVQFGRVADFYSMLTAKPLEKNQWNGFIGHCARNSLGKQWVQIVASHPECAQRLNQLIKAHFADGNSNKNFADNNIGVTIPSFPATSVLIGSAHDDATKAEAAYRQSLDPNFGKSFALSNPNDLRYGYWGREDLLALIAGHLDPSDEKSRRFMSLGQATWLTALGLSPAEPGLSPFKTFTNDGNEMTSAGGWVDLHPVLLLKASGCENVVYVTRRGGESLFGQGVAKRLLGLDRDWSMISTSSPEAKTASAKLNNNGDPSDLTSLWSRLYNLANPNSSFKRALKSADAVLCTSWDNFEPWDDDGINKMINDAYTSPFYLPDGSGLKAEKFSPLLAPETMNAGGYPEFAGCI